MASASLASASLRLLYRECFTLYVWPFSAMAIPHVLSHTVSVTVRFHVVARVPLRDVVARRLGRKSIPSGVVMVSGMETSTHATARSLSRPALETPRSSVLVSKRSANEFPSVSPYSWGVYDSLAIQKVCDGSSDG